MDKVRDIRGIRVPSFMYGTAWKEHETARLVRMAIDAGFRAIDTANQRKHYQEVAVGEALRDVLSAGVVTRDELFVQTKYTYRAGQDHRLPYDVHAPYAEQVEQSFTSSLEHLGLETIDSYVLHGPMYQRGLAPEDMEVWGAMEALHQAGTARLLGVSNVSADQLNTLCETAAVKPAFVQNRCFARTGWDHAVREVCRAHDIVYQGFSLLTANVDELSQPAFAAIMKDTGRGAAAVVFRFALQLGMLPLTGTTNPDHAAVDMTAFDFELAPGQMEQIENLAH